MRRIALISITLCVLLGLIVVSSANAAPTRADRGTWVPNVLYNAGDTVTYSGYTYRCLQTHTSITGWEPPNVPALWTPVTGPTAVSTSTPTRTPTRTNTPAGATNTPTRTPTRTNTPVGPTNTPTRTPTRTNTPAAPTNTPTQGGSSCSGLPQYVAGTAYAAGQHVQNIGNDYVCTVSGWCSSSAAWAYAPGTGTYWTSAWSLASTCGSGPTTTPTRTSTPGGATATPTLSPTTVGGAPAKPSISIQKVWDVGGGNYYDVIWSKWVGNDATSWDLLEDGQVIYSASIAPNNGSQTATYRVISKTYGVYTYRVVLKNSAGSTASDPASYAVGGASTIRISPIDSNRQALQASLPQGSTSLILSIASGSSATYSVVSNNASIATASISGSTLTVSGLKAGRASLRITASTGDVRYLGVRVKNADGSNPRMPGYVSIGSVSEDTDADLAFWRSGYTSGMTARRVDIRYIYINGGPTNGWRSWVQPDGWRVTSYVRESLKLGLIPFFVYYNIPDGGESYATDKQHIEDSTYMTAYFKDLKFFLDTTKAEAGDEMVGVVLEPDFIGYMMQNSGGKSPIPASQLLARTSAAYSSGVLTASDPQFPDTIAGLVQAINYIVKKNLPNATFGWQFNLWASPGITVAIPSTGICRLTDNLGIGAGRTAIASEAQAIANYYLNAGVTQQGANFVSIDKYGLDAGISSPSNPAASTWFWNADHWNNYLLFARTLGSTTGKPVILWQIPVGHINSSQLANPYSGGLFPNLANTSQHYEDSAPDFFLGDSFKPGSGRLSYFATNLGGDARISVSGDTVTWGSHMAEARASGIISILFGAGVGDSTDGIGSPPTDSYWWITAVQKYYLNGVIPIP